MLSGFSGHTESGHSPAEAQFPAVAAASHSRTAAQRPAAEGRHSPAKHTPAEASRKAAAEHTPAEGRLARLLRRHPARRLRRHPVRRLRSIPLRRDSTKLRCTFLRRGAIARLLRRHPVRRLRRIPLRRNAITRLLRRRPVWRLGTFLRRNSLRLRCAFLRRDSLRLRRHLRLSFRRNLPNRRPAGGTGRGLRIKRGVAFRTIHDEQFLISWSSQHVTGK